ncbi:hypothetical protein ACHAWF_004502 [Thalassiosira exigua]
MPRLMYGGRPIDPILSHGWRTICGSAARARRKCGPGFRPRSQSRCTADIPVQFRLLSSRALPLKPNSIGNPSSSTPCVDTHLRLPRRTFGAASPSNGHAPSLKQIYVSEQTISSAAANASPESPGADGKGLSGGKGTVVYRPNSDIYGGWEVVSTRELSAGIDAGATTSSALSASSKTTDFRGIQNLPLAHHFLPARYPRSVCPSYATYATYCFLGSTAGSASMVLSTQALLVAVGVGTQSAAPMAAALNWVLKDGAGQLGGVLFASQLGKGGMDFGRWRDKLRPPKWLPLPGGRKCDESEDKRGNFQRGTADTNPKRWRMVAAMALDLSALLEICTPLMGPGWFLPCASVANVGKNVGFLAASASRAAIHQSLCVGGRGGEKPASNAETRSESSARSSNLGDVTAKAGSQAILASLLGTGVGIFLSRTFCSDFGTGGIFAGFVALSAVHQVCTYKAVKAVPLRSLDRHRLHIVLSSYMGALCEEGEGCHESIAEELEERQKRYGKVLTPAQVAEKESFMPMMPPDDSVQWLAIGDPLTTICPSGVAELERLLFRNATAKSLVSSDTEHLDDENAFDPNLFEKYILKVRRGIVQLTFLEGATDDDLLRGMFHAYAIRSLAVNDANNVGDEDFEPIATQILKDTHALMSSDMPMFKESLRNAGWQTGSGFVNAECGSSHRLTIVSACVAGGR